MPIANTGSNISIFVLIAAALLGGAGSALGTTVAWAGVLLFATVTLFTLITLPVEFDASKRALVALNHGGYMTQEEVGGARKVLNAAAMTYVAAFVTSLLTFAVLGVPFGSHRRPPLTRKLHKLFPSSPASFEAGLLDLGTIPNAVAPIIFT